MKYLLVLLVVGIGIWMLVARLRGGGVAKRQEDAKQADKPAGKTQGPVAMVACAHCGLHLPAADALPAGSRLYCTDSHRRLGPASSPPAGPPPAPPAPPTPPTPPA